MTKQKSDYFIYEGCCFRDLVFYYPSLPEKHPRIEDLFPEKSHFKKHIYTNCYRGYVATWEIKKGKLYLINLDSEIYQISGTKSIFADWVCQTIKIVKSQKKQVLTIQEGIVAQSVEFELDSSDEVAKFWERHLNF